MLKCLVAYGDMNTLIYESPPVRIIYGILLDNLFTNASVNTKNLLT